MPQDQPETRVFISHSSKDKEFVHRLVEDLRTHGVELWLDDEQILVGESITERIADGLAASTDLIIVLSGNFLASPWCKTELRTVLHKYIKSREKRILPLEITPLPESAWNDFPLIFMEDTLRLDMQPTAYRHSLDELLRALGPHDSHAVNPPPETPMEASIEAASAPEKIGAIDFHDQGMMYVFDYDSIADPHPVHDILAFITEEETHYINYETGSCLNFSLRNLHTTSITVFSLGVEIVKFYDSASTEFGAFDEVMPRDIGGGASAPVEVYVLHVQLARNTAGCKAAFLATDDSAGSRGLIFRGHGATSGSPPDRFSRLRSLAKTAFGFYGATEQAVAVGFYGATEQAVAEGGPNALSPTTRFAIKPGEADAFHCRVTAQEPGIYWYRFVVSFHFDAQKSIAHSDRAFVCFIARPKR